MPAVAPGWRFDPKRCKLVYDKQREVEDRNISDTIRTAKILAEVANSIYPNIQITTDYPKNNSDGRMPILDLKIWVSRDKSIPTISHTFYKKPVASPFVILKRSAVAEGVKKDTIFQECLR